MVWGNVKKAGISSLLAIALVVAPLAGVGNLSSARVEAAGAVKQEQIKVLIDGKQLALSAAVIRKNNVNFVPMRELFDAFGANVTFLPAEQSIRGVKQDLFVFLKIGSKAANINGKSIQLSDAVFVANGRSYVPVRLIAEAFGARVTWDAKQNSIVITTQGDNQANQQETNADRADELLNYYGYTFDDVVSARDDSVVLIETNKGQGSGIAVAPQLIMTNYHVIDDVSEAVVHTTMQETFEVEGVVVYNKNADLAILKTKKPHNLEAVKLLGGIDTYKGEPVIAISSPLGLQNTVSTGVVSGMFVEDGVQYIQTSAPIDSGSSGGALFDKYGNLLGVITSGYANTQASLNFAVSVDHAQKLLEQASIPKMQQAAFLPYSLPASLKGESLATITALMNKHFSKVPSSEGTMTLSNWTVERDPEGWFVFKANLPAAFYQYYSSDISQDLKSWTYRMGQELARMLPNEKLEVKLMYDDQFDFPVRGLNNDELIKLAGGKYQVIFPAVHMQIGDKTYVKVRN